MRLSPATLIAAFFLSGSTTRLWPGPLPSPGIVLVTATDLGSIARACTWLLGKSYVQIRAPSQYVCSLDNQRTEAPSGRVSRTWRLATSISVTSFEPTLKTYTVSRLSAPAEGDVVGLDDPQAEASRPSAALLAPLRTARRSSLEDRNQSVPPTSTPFASSREAQSSGPQCEGGLAAERGLIIAFDIVTLLYSEPGSMPFGGFAGTGRSHFKKCPCPGSAVSLPSSTTTSPRERTSAGQPRTRMPS